MKGVAAIAATHDTSSAIVTTEKIAKVYSPVEEFGGGNRQKSGRGDQGAGKHRKRGAGVGEGGCLEAVEALFHLSRHHFDHDHGVIDQQARAR